MTEQVKTTQWDWRAEVYKVDPPPAYEVIYEFEGREFTEQFNPSNGPYDGS